MTIERICVVTVCLNVRDSIRLTLESVKRQNFGAVDHVIIDGGSTDGTLDIIKEYRVAHLTSEKDAGVYDAMDKGRLVATGDAAIFLNAGDTFFDDDVCRDVASFFNNSGADIVFGNLMPVYLRANDTHDHAAFKVGHMVEGSGLRDLSQLYDSSIHHQATFYRTALLKKVTYKCEVPEATGEYNLLLNAIMRHQASVKYIDRPIARFALGGISTRDFASEWARYAVGREALQKMYFNGVRPIDGKNAFVHKDADNYNAIAGAAVLAGTVGTVGSSFRGLTHTIRTRAKTAIRGSFVFGTYRRIATNVAQRTAMELMPPLTQATDARIRAATAGLHEENRRLEAQVGALGGQLSAHSSQLSAFGTQLSAFGTQLSAIETGVHRGHYFIEHAQARQNMLGAQTLKRLLDTSVFNESGFGVYSQWDEDGLIEYLVSRLDGCPEYFVEIGVGDYREANTRLLLERRNWRGAIFDQSSSDIDRVRHSQVYWRYGVSALSATVDKSNVDALTKTQVGARDVGLLSIDVDGVDYWLWDAIVSISPWIVIVEYNGIFGGDAAISVPYRPDFDRTKAHYSWLYGGASIGAFRHLGSQKGYTLVGVNSARNNAFFVRNDVLAKSSIKYDPYVFKMPNFRESRNPDGSLSLLFLEDGVKLISDLPVVDVRSGRELTVREAVGGTTT
jgi:glycosyltransferase involved in cell wall biosynthesis